MRYLHYTIFAYQAIVRKPDGEEERFQGTLTLVR